jgi:hypothetical protein
MGLLGGDGMVANLHPPKRGLLGLCRFPLSACGDLRAIRRSGRSAQRREPNLLRRVGPFLKEFVKRKRFSSSWLRNGSAGRSHECLRLVGRPESCVLLVVAVSALVPVVVATGSCNRSFPSAIAPNTFLRKVPLTIPVSSSARSWTRTDADVSGANSSPEGPLHPEQRAAGLGHCWLMPPHPRSDSSWP